MVHQSWRLGCVMSSLVLWLSATLAMILTYRHILHAHLLCALATAKRYNKTRLYSSRKLQLALLLFILKLLTASQRQVSRVPAQRHKKINVE